MDVSRLRTNGTNESERFLLEQLLVIITSRWSVRNVGNYCPSMLRVLHDAQNTKYVLGVLARLEGQKLPTLITEGNLYQLFLTD